MVAYLRGLGGLHAAGDFERAKGEYVTPIKTEFRGRTVYECPPNGQGIIALMILKILSRFEVKPDPLDLDNLHIEIEATRLAYAARDALLPTRPWPTFPSAIFSPITLPTIWRRRLIFPMRSRLAHIHRCEHQDTVYIAVVDKDRNAVSFINSIFGP